ncbi:hypothetical protein MB828_11640, partial [Streptomyces arenae]|nr:hypothetical protein [Streptomyces arenae]
MQRRTTESPATVQRATVTPAAPRLGLGAPVLGPATTGAPAPADPKAPTASPLSPLPPVPSVQRQTPATASPDHRSDGQTSAPKPMPPMPPMPPGGLHQPEPLPPFLTGAPAVTSTTPASHLPVSIQRTAAAPQAPQAL